MSLTNKRAAIALLLIQSAIALSVAGSYAYDRVTKPRVWVRTQQVDPSTPLRGRYLALQLTVDGCSLPAEQATSSPYQPPIRHREFRRTLTWPVTLHAVDGRLVATALPKPLPEVTQTVSLSSGEPCTAARLDQSVDYFIGDRTDLPAHFRRDNSPWVEVTVPSTGPPRPIRLAVSGKAGWHVLTL